MTPGSKWEAILELELKPKSLQEQLVEEAAKLLAKELAGPFPPETGGLEPAEAARFAVLFQEPRVRPDAATFRAAFQQARLDLLREFEASAAHERDHARRNPPQGREHLAMLLLSRWLTEQLLSLKDQLRTRLSREQLAEILARTERRLLDAQGAA